jgi:hypothetical protein
MSLEHVKTWAEVILTLVVMAIIPARVYRFVLWFLVLGGLIGAVLFGI